VHEAPLDLGGIDVEAAEMIMSIRRSQMK